MAVQAEFGEATRRRPGLALLWGDFRAVAHNGYRSKANSELLLFLATRTLRAGPGSCVTEYDMDVMAESTCAAEFSTSDFASSVGTSDSVDSRWTEEGMNQATHGLGFGLSVLGAIHLLTRCESVNLMTAGCWIYAISLVALYAASTLSHSFDAQPRRNSFRTLDQICIFAMMAATFTPVSLNACGIGFGNVPMVMMWCMALVGIYLKLKVTKQDMVPVWYYVVLGLLPILAMPQLCAALGIQGTCWFLAGGCCYLLGVIFLTNDHRNRFFHPTWHVLVILGSACHYVVISEYSLGLA